MGSIISSGVGSGLDIAGLVQKLVEAEGAPKTIRLNTEEAKVQAKLSALGSLRSALASFQSALGVLKSADKFQGRQISLSTPNFISATATSGAVTGSYSIEVTQLAAAHKLQSQPYAGDDTAGIGTLTIEVGDEQFHLVIDGTNNTLAGIAAAINTVAGHKVQATVITGAEGAVLTLSARNTGTDNAIALSQSGDGDLAAFVAGFESIRDAQNAEALIDGIEVTSFTNTLSGAVAGLEIRLLAVSGDDPPTELTVSHDRTRARKNVDDLVKAYNSVVDSIKAVSSFNAETRQGGPLFGDAGVRNIAYQLRRELMSTVTGLDGSFDMLNEIGITAQLDGKLSVDAAKLDAAFTADFDAIGELFAADGVGVAVRLDALLQPYLGPGGVFDSRTESLRSSIEDIGERREALSQRLGTIQARYLRQFNALDGLLAQMQSTSNFLTQQLSRLSDISLFNRN